MRVSFPEPPEPDHSTSIILYLMMIMLPITQHVISANEEGFSTCYVVNHTVFLHIVWKNSAGSQTTWNPTPVCGLDCIHSSLGAVHTCMESETPSTWSRPLFG